MTDQSRQERTEPSANFDAFNARFINPSEVARTFVPPAQFDTVSEGNNSVLSGPRGSGKTTLLKMLTLDGLSAWRHPRRDEFLKKISYTAIFVGADILWTGQLDAIAGRATSTEVQSQVHEALFRIHICFSVLDALATCERLATHDDPLLNRFGISLTEDGAAELVRELADAWALRPAVDSFRGLRSALRADVSAIEQYVRAIGRGETPAAPKSLGISWLSAVTAFVDLVNHAIGDRERAWALLVDELEITRPRLRDEVFAALRSTDRRLILKLALFPFQGDAAAGEFVAAPTPSNDYQPVVLWYARKENGFPFCEALLRMLVREESGEPFTGAPEDIFGVSRFDGGREANRKTRALGTSAYAPGGAVHSDFKWLLQSDPSFADYIRRRQIDIDTMAELSEPERAAKIRKLLPITIVRRHFRRSEESWTDQRRQRVRSTSGLDLYTGAYSIFALSEANPRIFINLARPLVRFYLNSGRRRVPSLIQERQILAVLNRFRAFVAATPYARGTTGGSVWDFIDAIGAYFEARVLFDDFTADAPLQFELDSSPSPLVRDLIGRAVNLGLIVPMPGANRDALFRDLANVKFRLAYTICPYFRLPLATTGVAVMISSILKWDDRAVGIEPNRFRRRASELGADQLSLPIEGNS